MNKHICSESIYYLPHAKHYLGSWDILVNKVVKLTGLYSSVEKSEFFKVQTEMSSMKK